MSKFPWRTLAALVFSSFLAACGGGGGDTAAPAAPPPAAIAAAAAKPATRNEAARFLAQATFGATDSDVDRVMSLGYAAWIDEQLAMPATSHRAWWEARNAEITAASTATPPATAGQDQVLESFWRQALTGPDQLRQRMAYALSQIMVVSMVDSSVANDTRSMAAWLDMLNEQGLGNYRQLLEAVSRHPVMGTYLTSLRNQKANAKTGRVPDENYAREVMQLFSIGLVELNDDGSARTGAGGEAIETYTPADVSGMARVFTGFSLACGDLSNSCFNAGGVGGVSDPDRGFKPMVGYPQHHSTEEKRFLSVTIPVQSVAAPEASLTTALDTLAGHANVGPFIGRQLIQRLVTSNPSPAYITAVARAFANNGQGVRGDMKAVLKAVLMHPEARVVSDTSGKVREPVLRLSAFMRAFPHKSDTGSFKVGNTDNPGTALGQTPLRAASVFNFYRPGFVAPGTGAAARGLVTPELQLASETTAAGWTNFMRDNISSGVGQFNGTVGGVVLNRRDLQADYSGELALAADAPPLVARVADKLAYGNVGSALQADIAAAVTSIAIPALNAKASNQAQIDAAKRNRVNAAILLVLASPEFQVQK